jgi:DNA-binding transcriptional LysR family regulator
VNWFDGLQAFLSVANEQSFSKAARSLSLPASVVTKRVQWLESRLNITLFIRTTRNVWLTESGEFLQTRAAPLLDAWGELHNELLDFNDRPQGLLTIAFAPNLVELPLFCQCLRDFSQKHPEINLALKTATISTRMVDQQIDLLIGIDRYIGEPETSKRVPLFDYHYGCYASPLYLKKNTSPITLKNLCDQQTLGYGNVTQWLFGHHTVNITPFATFDTGAGLLQACKEGMGIMYYPDFMAAPMVAKKVIKKLFPGQKTQKQTLCLYYTDRPYQSKKIRTFIDYIKAALKH